eukprot:jgi/Botrbrau1/1310/Bobra.0063s0027.1
MGGIFLHEEQANERLLWKSLFYGKVNDARQAWEALPQHSAQTILKALFYATKGPRDKMEDSLVWILTELQRIGQGKLLNLECEAPGLPDVIKQRGVFCYLLENVAPSIAHSERVCRAAVMAHLPPPTGPEIGSMNWITKRLVAVGPAGKDLVRLAAMQGYQVGINYPCDSYNELTRPNALKSFKWLFDEQFILEIPSKGCPHEPVLDILFFALELEWENVAKHVLKCWPVLRVNYDMIETAGRLGWTEVKASLEPRCPGSRSNSMICMEKFDKAPILKGESPICKGKSGPVISIVARTTCV